MSIYLDNAATTHLAPEVFEAMKPYMLEFHGNPSATHAHYLTNTIIYSVLPIVYFFYTVHKVGLEPTFSTTNYEYSSYQDDSVLVDLAVGERVELSRVYTSPGFKSGSVASFRIDLLFNYEYKYIEQNSKSQVFL